MREAADRVLGLRHYRVQLLGGIVLHQGRIAEMRTGEGKTLVATLPAYLNALTGQGVHIVTVNDYLARRDSEWMGKVYRFLGMTVGLVVHGVPPEEKHAAYAADITYGTNNEFGFDYLRDNMVIYKEQMVQRGHAFAIVDEVDSILIDEARTPLIISGAGDDSSDLYQKADALARSLTPVKVLELDAKQDNDDMDGDYIIDEKARSVHAHRRRRSARPSSISAWKALQTPKTPRSITTSSRRSRPTASCSATWTMWSRTAKSSSSTSSPAASCSGGATRRACTRPSRPRSMWRCSAKASTLATITFQNYFRLYKKLSGMTGTALTEEAEFREIYKLDVIVVPTNRPMIRVDHPDVVYKTEAAKFTGRHRQHRGLPRKGAARSGGHRLHRKE